MFFCWPIKYLLRIWLIFYLTYGLFLPYKALCYILQGQHLCGNANSIIVPISLFLTFILYKVKNILYILRYIETLHIPSLSCIPTYYNSLKNTKPSSHIHSPYDATSSNFMLVSLLNAAAYFRLCHMLSRNGKYHSN